MKKPMKTLLRNAIIGWFDNHINSYKALDDPEFVREVCDAIGISNDEYNCLVFDELIGDSDVDLISEDMSSSEIFTNLSERQRDDIYRMVWSDRVAEDVSGRLLENPDLELTEEEEDSLVEDVCNAYVYNGDYDCNLCYWDNIDNLINEHMPNKAKSKEIVTAVKTDNRTRLTNEEFNLVSIWTRRTKFDSVMDIGTNDDGDDVWFDYENDEELSLKAGFKEMAEAVAYKFEHEGFTEEEAKVLLNLLEEFGVDEDTLDYIRYLKE